MEYNEGSSYLPWSKQKLEEILRDLIENNSEGTKFDFKGEMPVATPADKADFLKDVLAFVNTRDNYFHNHGLIIYGAVGGEITGISTTEPDPEKYQLHLENLIRAYLAPFVPIQVMAFKEESRDWGVVVIPPSNRLPHQVFKDYQIRGGDGDPNKSLYRGQWFVRRGSTTDVATPEDYARILGDTIDARVRPLEDQTKNLRAFYETLDSKVDTLLARQQPVVFQPTASGTPTPVTTAARGEPENLDLPSRLQQRLRGPDDPLKSDLLNETLELYTWLEAANGELPWNFNHIESSEITSDYLRGLLEKIEARTENLLRALAVILIEDENNSFDQTVFRVVRTLAREIPPPSHTSSNSYLDYLRRYPLALVI